MKLLWTGKSLLTKKVFSKYSNKELLDIVSEFPKVERDDGSTEVVT